MLMYTNMDPIGIIVMLIILKSAFAVQHKQKVIMFVVMILLVGDMLIAWGAESCLI